MLPEEKLKLISKKEKSMKQIKEYKIKKDNLSYVDSFGNPIKVDGFFYPKSYVADYFSSIGILDNEELFEKVYENEYSVGDWVTVLDTPNVRGYDKDAIGHVFQLVDDNITNFSSDNSTTEGGAKGSQKYGVNYRKNDFRKATEEEILQAKLPKVGDYIYYNFNGVENLNGEVHKILSLKEGKIITDKSNYLMNLDQYNEYYSKKVRIATPEEILAAQTIKIGKYIVEILPNRIKVGCQKFSKSEIETIKRLVSSPINASFSIESTIVGESLIDKILAKL